MCLWMTQIICWYFIQRKDYVSRELAMVVAWILFHFVLSLRRPTSLSRSRLPPDSWSLPISIITLSPTCPFGAIPERHQPGTWRLILDLFSFPSG